MAGLVKCRAGEGSLILPPHRLQVVLLAILPGITGVVAKALVCVCVRVGAVTLGPNPEFLPGVQNHQGNP